MRMKRIVVLLRASVGRRAGFTLIELMIVIIIVALLAAIAIPTFLGQRTKARDAATYTMVRQGLTVVQSVAMDTVGYTGVTEGALEECDPSIDWVQAEVDDLVDITGPSIASGFGAEANKHQLAYIVESNTRMDIASTSESGNRFGIQVDTQSISDTGYVQVKVVSGEGAELGW